MDPVQDLDEEAIALLESAAPLLLPDINLSNEKLGIEGNALRLGLSCVKGLSDKDIQSIIHERENGPFVDLCDFLGRVPFIHRKAEGVGSLIRCGAFDFNDKSRSALLGWRVSDEMHNTISDLEEYWNSKMQTSLVDDDWEIEDTQRLVFSKIAKRLELDCPRESIETLLSMEESSLLYRPYSIQIAPYKKALRRLRLESRRTGRTVRYGRIRNIEPQSTYTEKGRLKEYSIKALFEDNAGADQIQLVTKKRAFESLKIRDGSLVQVGQALGEVNEEVLCVDYIKPMPPARELLKKIMIWLEPQELTEVKLFRLKSTMDCFPGVDSVRICTELGGKKSEIDLPVFVNASAPAFMPSLRRIFDHYEMKVSFDEDLYQTGADYA